MSEESDVCKEEEESETRAISLMKSTRRRRMKMKVFSPKHAGDDDIGFNERELQTVNEGKRSESMARINQKEITPETFSTYYRRGRRGKERKKPHCHLEVLAAQGHIRQKNPDDFGSPRYKDEMEGKMQILARRFLVEEPAGILCVALSQSRFFPNLSKDEDDGFPNLSFSLIDCDLEGGRSEFARTIRKNGIFFCCSLIKRDREGVTPKRSSRIK